MAYTSNEELQTIAREGLPPKAVYGNKVIVVGGGMAGLVAAYELRRAGHEVTLLEAQTRLGGRILTIRTPFTHGLYAEAGAMRVPGRHKLTMSYIERFKLPVKVFPGYNPNSYLYLRGKRYRMGEVLGGPHEANPALASDPDGLSVMQLWEKLMVEMAVQVEKDPSLWERIGEVHDRYSYWEYLKSLGWDDVAIEALGLITTDESSMRSSAAEILRLSMTVRDTEKVSILGGMDLLPNAFLPDLEDVIRFGAEMVALEQSESGVTIHYRTPGGREQISGDYAVLALPFPALRYVNVLTPFSNGKQKAIRQLHYMPWVKILLQYKRRFWEDDVGIFGGDSVTDLPARNLFYPTQGKETGRGVILASFTGADDAVMWGALSPQEKIVRAAEDVEKIHPGSLRELEGGASKDWQNDRFAGGVCAWFDPGQEGALFKDMIAPEGRVFFAGEHNSHNHGWIEGAVETGLRAARDIHQASLSETR
ncbi:MAG: FAD-dependent oxidoreductase [Chloroflexia bacterium]